MMLNNTSSKIEQIKKIQLFNKNKNSKMITTEKSQSTILKAPRFTPQNLQAVISKVQPYRKGGIRLEHEQLKGKHVFHNYGHGGSGISLAYGSSFMSVKSIYTYLNVDHPVECAVIGSGLIALLTALQIVKAGHLATIYADKFAKYGQTDYSKKMVSQVDQGLWFPFGYDTSDKLRHELLSKISFDYYRQCLKTCRYQSFKTVTLYEKDSTIKQLKQRIPGFLYNGYKQAQVNFGNGQSQKYIRMKVIKIQTELFLQQLRVQANLRGIKFVQRKFNNQQQVLGLKQQCIFNCTGLASKNLFHDENMREMTDYYVLFKNPTNLNYTINANLRQDLHMRVHCHKDKIILRSQTPVQNSSQQFIKDLVRQSQQFFDNRTTRPKL